MSAWVLAPALALKGKEEAKGVCQPARDRAGPGVGLSRTWVSYLRGRTKHCMWKVAAQFGWLSSSGNQCELPRVTHPYATHFWDLFPIPSLHCLLPLHGNSTSSFHIIWCTLPFPKDSNCEWIVSESKQNELFLFFSNFMRVSSPLILVFLVNVKKNSPRSIKILFFLST